MPPSKEDYFESLHYSAAVVGLNTSAFLEAAIVDRPVHTILAPEFSDNQQGTLHFHYLLNVGGGVLRTSTSFAGAPRAVGGVARFVAGVHRASNQRFVREFITAARTGETRHPSFVRRTRGDPRASQRLHRSGRRGTC